MKKSTLLKILPLIMSLSVSLSVQAKPQNQISFTSDITGENQLYLVNEDGSDLTNISTPNFQYKKFSGIFSWSPNGKYLAFDKYEEGVNKLYIMEFETKKTVEIPFYSEYSISWRHDSSLLALSLKKDKNTNSKIYLVSPNGDNLHIIYDDKTNQSEPKWSPNGEKILFLSSVIDKKTDLENRVIKIVNKDGTNPIKIFSGKTPSLNYNQEWFPDSKKIIFNSKYNDNENIFLFDIEKNNVKNILKNKFPNIKANYSDPKLSPNGDKLAFKVNFNENNKNMTEIYILDMKTLKINKIIKKQFGVEKMLWSYDSNQIFISFLTELFDFKSEIFDITGKSISKSIEEPLAFWSPNNHKISFFSSIKGKNNILLLDTDSKKIHKLIDNGKLISWRVQK